MHVMWRGSAVLFFLFLFAGTPVLPASAHPSGPPGILRFGVFPYKSPRSIIEIFAPLAARLEEKLGRKVRLVSAPDAETFLARGKSGEYDLALPAVTVYYKMQPAGYRAIARGVPSFWGGVIVLRESEIRTPNDFKGRKVAAIGGHSYASYLFFKKQLEEKGLVPGKDVEFHFLGKLDSILYGVVNRKYDAGVVRLDSLEAPDFAAFRERFRVVARSPEIPQFPFVVKDDLDARTVSAIQEVLTALSPERPKDREILQSLQIDGIVAARDSDYAPFFEQVRDIDYLRQ